MIHGITRRSKQYGMDRGVNVSFRLPGRRCRTRGTGSLCLHGNKRTGCLPSASSTNDLEKIMVQQLSDMMVALATNAQNLESIANELMEQIYQLKYNYILVICTYGQDFNRRLFPLLESLLSMLASSHRYLS